MLNHVHPIIPQLVRNIIALVESENYGRLSIFIETPVHYIFLTFCKILLDSNKSNMIIVIKNI